MAYKRRSKIRCGFCHRSMAIGDKYVMIGGIICCLAAECRCRAEFTSSDFSSIKSGKEVSEC